MSAVLQCKENRTVLPRYSLEINIFCHYPNKVIQTKTTIDVTDLLLGSPLSHARHPNVNLHAGHTLTHIEYLQGRRGREREG